MGKPSQAVFDQALVDMELKTRDVVMIGDDIALMLAWRRRPGYGGFCQDR